MNEAADTATIPAQGLCLGVDYGTRRIGLAVGELSLGTARPLSIVDNHNGTPDWAALDRVLDEWKPVALVVGWPLTIEGDENPVTPHVRGFSKRLGKRTGLPVFHVNEAFTSTAAQSAIADMRERGQRRTKSTHADVDTLAAALLLEAWFEQHRRTRTPHRAGSGVVSDSVTASSNAPVSERDIALKNNK